MSIHIILKDMSVFDDLGPETLTKEYKEFVISEDEISEEILNGISIIPTYTMHFDEPDEGDDDKHKVNFEKKRIIYSSLSDFYSSGQINFYLNKIIIGIIKSHLKEYIPKYTAGFLNADTLDDGYLYYGVNDAGITTGIPFNAKYMSLNLLKREIVNTIHEYLVLYFGETGKAIRDYISIDLIALNDDNDAEIKNYRRDFLEKQKKYITISNAVKALEKKKHINAITYNSITMNSVTKQQANVNVILAEMAGKYNFTAEIKFILLDSFKLFNPRTDYDSDYVQNMERFTIINEYVVNKYLNTIMTYIHEELKIYRDIIRSNNSAEKSIIEQNIANLSSDLKGKYNTYKKVHNLISSHAYNILKHPDNVFFVIRISFHSKLYRQASNSERLLYEIGDRTYMMVRKMKADMDYNTKRIIEAPEVVNLVGDS